MSSQSPSFSAEPASRVKVYPFGTSGYRNNTDEGFNTQVILQITDAIADLAIQKMITEQRNLPILLGGDTREKTHMAIPLIAQRLMAKGIDVYKAQTDIPTPVLAYAASHLQDYKLPYTECAFAILMTASHNPWEYGGYNLLTPDGAVASTAITKTIEALQAAPLNLRLDRTQVKLPPGVGLEPGYQTIDFNAAYLRHLDETINIDWHAILESNPMVAYDPLYATGRHIFPEFLRNKGLSVLTLHTDDLRPAGYTGMPEPNGSNLVELKQLLHHLAHDNPERLLLGLANDGDADRFGVMAASGEMLTPNQVLLLVLYHLMTHRHTGLPGQVVCSQATSHQVFALAEKYGLTTRQTPVGYKYIAECFIEAQEAQAMPVVLGGESSGGLSILHHIPEKDGLLANLLILELMGKERKPLETILRQVETMLETPLAFAEASAKTKQGPAILNALTALIANSDSFNTLALDTATTSQHRERLKQDFGTADGVKLFFKDGSWLLVRVSGTEPLVRFYLEAPTDQLAPLRAALRTWLKLYFNLTETDLHWKQ
jgi:phosphomannomutase